MVETERVLQKVQKSELQRTVDQIPNRARRMSDNGRRIPVHLEQSELPKFTPLLARVSCLCRLVRSAGKSSFEDCARPSRPEIVVIGAGQVPHRALRCAPARGPCGSRRGSAVVGVVGDKLRQCVCSLASHATRRE
jgi:hypothetical protein